MKTDEQHLQELLDFLEAHKPHGIEPTPEHIEEVDTSVEIMASCPCGESMFVRVQQANLDAFFGRLVVDLLEKQSRIH